MIEHSIVLVLLHLAPISNPKNRRHHNSWVMATPFLVVDSAAAGPGWKLAAGRVIPALVLSFAVAVAVTLGQTDGE